jgi:hypothetical protein
VQGSRYGCRSDKHTERSSRPLLVVYADMLSLPHLRPVNALAPSRHATPLALFDTTALHHKQQRRKPGSSAGEQGVAAGHDKHTERCRCQLLVVAADTQGGMSSPSRSRPVNALAPSRHVTPLALVETTTDRLQIA